MRMTAPSRTSPASRACPIWVSTSRPMYLRSGRAPALASLPDSTRLPDQVSCYHQGLCAKVRVPSQGHTSE